VAFWHAPRFSSGQHGHDYHTDHKATLLKARPMKNAFALLNRHGASVILNGHEHNLEQFLPANAEGKRVGDGIRLFVNGPLSRSTRPRPPSRPLPAVATSEK
jgi:hypothetical protein